MRRKKATAILTTLMLSASVSAGAAAAEASPANIQGGSVSVSAPVAMPELPMQHISELGSNNARGNAAMSGVQALDVNMEDLKSDVPEVRMPSGGTGRNGPSTYSTNNTASNTYLTQSTTGTLEAEGEIYAVPVILESGQILTVSLVCPQDEYLDYDLLLLEPDTSTGTLRILTYSDTVTCVNTYPNGSSKTVDEGLSYINTSSAEKSYYVGVQAKDEVNANASFTLTLSIGLPGYYDVAEPNDNFRFAYPIQGSISGAQLHAPNDQDWFVWNNTSPDIGSVNLSVDAGYRVEAYVTDGYSMILVEPNADGTLPVSEDKYYIRVYANSGSFTASTYTLTLAGASLRVSQIRTKLSGDNPNDEGGYVTYHQGYCFRFTDSISVEAQLLSPSGYAIPNQPVTFEWVSGEWAVSTGNHSRSVTGRTNSQGKVTLTIEGEDMPPAVGGHSYSIPGAISFTHRYDFDEVFLSTPGLERQSAKVYHFYVSSYD